MLKGALASYSTLFWDQPRQSFPFRDQGLNPLPFLSFYPFFRIIFVVLDQFGMPVPCHHIDCRTTAAVLALQTVVWTRWVDGMSIGNW